MASHNRFRLKVFIFALTTLLLSACQSDGQEETAGQDSTQTEAADAPDQEGGHLQVGYGEDSYGTIGDRPDIGKWPLNTRTFDTLVNMTEDFEVEPMLATDWEQDNDTFRFNLREGVTMHDGTEFTAGDVEYTFGLIAESDPNNYQKLGPDSVSVVDDHTVEITPTETNNRLVEQLVHPSFGIHAEGSDPGDAIGAGPFQLVEYEQDDHLTVEAFDEYWNEEARPSVQRITFRFMPDMQGRILALRSGELDVIGEVAPEALQEVEADPSLEVARSTPGATARVDFNLLSQLGGNQNIREAVAHAMDREALVQEVFLGNADPQPLSPALFGEHASLVEGVPHDPDHARQLLEEEGWAPNDSGILEKDGEQLRLTYLAQPSPEAERTGEVLQNQLRDVGIRVEIAPVGDAGAAQEQRESGDWDLLRQGGSQNEANPCFIFDLLYYSPEKGGFDNNRFVAPGGEVDEAIEGCRTAEGQEELRRQAAEVAKMLEQEYYVRMPVGTTHRIFVHQDRVSSLQPHPSLGRAEWESVELDVD